jgi:serine/threonine protein kinase
MTSSSTQGHVFINQYLLIKDLGKGAQGTVKLCLDTQNDSLYAMKVLPT